MADITGEDEWSDWENEEIPAKSLLEDRILPSAQEALQYDKETYGFDLLALRTKLSLDFYGCVKLVNYVRTEINASDNAASGDIKVAAAVIEGKALSTHGGVLADERYLRPALADDAILLCLEELLLLKDAEDDDAQLVQNGHGQEEHKIGTMTHTPTTNIKGGKEERTNGNTITSESDKLGTVQRNTHAVRPTAHSHCAAGTGASGTDAGDVGVVQTPAVDVQVAAATAPAGRQKEGNDHAGLLLTGETRAAEIGSTGGAAIADAKGCADYAGGPCGQAVGMMGELERENARLREALREAEERMNRANRVLRGLVNGGADGAVVGGDGADGGVSDADAGEGSTGGGVDNDTYYFRSYAHWGVHETMLTDTVRTGGYERAICDNAHFFKGKVVLDVGCGTGVLSCFAARAGARRVIGVDRSDIVLKAREVVRDNGFDQLVTLVKGKVEDVDIGVDKVDVIISEWMGYCLFYESMLPSVLFAREKYLVDGGAMLPDRTPLFIEGWRDPDKRLEFWQNVHGLDYSSMAELPLDEASIEVVRSHDIVTQRCLCQDFNLETVKDKDLDFSAPFELVVTSPGTVSGLVISFDTGFFAGSSPTPSHPPPPPLQTSNNSTLPTMPAAAGGNESNRANDNCAIGANFNASTKASWFSTGPGSTPTHWKQTLLWLRPSDREGMVLDTGDAVIGRLTLDRNEVNPRELGLRVTWSATRQRDRKTYGGTQAYAVC